MPDAVEEVPDSKFHARGTRADDLQSTRMGPQQIFTSPKMVGWIKNRRKIQIRKVAGHTNGDTARAVAGFDGDLRSRYPLQVR